MRSRQDSLPLAPWWRPLQEGSGQKIHQSLLLVGHGRTPLFDSWGVLRTPSKQKLPVFPRGSSCKASTQPGHFPCLIQCQVRRCLFHLPGAWSCGQGQLWPEGSGPLPSAGFPHSWEASTEAGASSSVGGGGESRGEGLPEGT